MVVYLNTAGPKVDIEQMLFALNLNMVPYLQYHHFGASIPTKQCKGNLNKLDQLHHSVLLLFYRRHTIALWFWQDDLYSNLHT